MKLRLGAIRSREVAVAGSAGERHVLRLRDRGGAAGRRLIPPIEVRVRDDLVRRRSAPCALIFGRVRVADEGDVDLLQVERALATESMLGHRVLRGPTAPES